MEGKGSLDTDAAGNVTNREGAIGAAATADSQDDTLKDLDSLFTTFADLLMHSDHITGSELRGVGFFVLFGHQAEESGVHGSSFRPAVFSEERMSREAFGVVGFNREEIPLCPVGFGRVSVDPSGTTATNWG